MPYVAKTSINNTYAGIIPITKKLGGLPIRGKEKKSRHKKLKKKKKKEKKKKKKKTATG